MRLRCLAVVVALLLAGCSAGVQQPTPTATPQVVESEVETGNISLDGLPVSTEFAVVSQSAKWTFPVRIEFQRPDAGNWTEAYALRVSENEWFSVELTGGEQYRIVVSDSTGREVAVGIYTPLERDSRERIILDPCCVDDFSTVDHDG